MEHNREGDNTMLNYQITKNKQVYHVGIQEDGNKTTVFINGTSVGCFVGQEEGFLIITKDGTTTRNTHAQATGYLTDRFFNQIRNARGVFRK